MHNELAARLRAGGFDVVTARDAGMMGMPDDAVFAFAVSQDRVLFTHDRRDFPRIAREWASAAKEHSGLLYSRQTSPSTAASWIIQAVSLYADMRNLTLSLPLAE